MRWTIRLSLAISFLLVLVISGLAIAESFTQYEYYNLYDDGDQEIYLNNYFAQTFTVGNMSHTADRIRLKMYAEGATPGNLYVSLRTTNSSGYPNGIDISTGSYTGSTMTTSSPGQWYEVQMSNISLKAGNKYAIVCYGTGTTSALNIHWRHDIASANYSGGGAYNSTNGGITWADNTSSDFMFEVWGNTVINISDARVFQTYNESGDWIIVMRYECNDPIFAPYSNPAETWTMQLLDATGTVVAQDPLQAWGVRPGSIYLSAAEASALEWGNTNYQVKIVSNSNSATYASFNLTASAWYGTAMSQLKSWCLYTARLMEAEDSATYIINVMEHGDVLNVAGGTLFTAGIPYLDKVIPDLFYVTTEDIGSWNESLGPGTYEQSLDNWQALVGPELTADFNNAGSFVGLSGRYIGGLFVFITFLILAGLAVSTGHFTAGLSLSSVVLIGGVLMGLIPMGALFVAIALLVVLFIKNFWWQGA